MCTQTDACRGHMLMIAGFASDTVMLAFTALSLNGFSTRIKREAWLLYTLPKIRGINSHTHPRPHEYTNASLYLLLLCKTDNVLER